MVLSHKYLRHHLWHNTIFGLPFFTYADVFVVGRITQISAVLYQYLTELIMVLTFLACVSFLPMAVTDIDLLCASLAPVTHSWQLVAKTLHLKLYRKRFIQHLNDLEGILKGNKKVPIKKGNLCFEDFFKLKSRHIRWIHTCHLFGQLVSTAIFFGPVTVEFIYYFSDKTPLPIVSYIPWETKTVGAYGAAYTLLLSGFVLYNAKMVTIDYFIIDIIVLHYSQVLFLNKTMQSIIDNIMGKYGIDAEDEKTLKEWLYLHQNSIRSTRDLKSLLSGYLIVEYVYVFIHTCMPAFVITSTISWNWMQKVALICIVSSALLSFFLLTAAGHALHAVSGSIRNTIYGPWLVTNPQMKKIYLMYSALELRPFYLKFTSLFPLCFPTVVAISRLILTYYMTLNELQTIKKKTSV